MTMVTSPSTSSSTSSSFVSANCQILNNNNTTSATPEDKMKDTTKNRSNSIQDKITKSSSSSSSSAFDWVGYSLVLLIILITLFGYPQKQEQQPDSPDTKAKVSIYQVWYYGWITAVSTGLGVIPFYFVSSPDAFWKGISNAGAAGMMLAASYSLIVEGWEPIEGFYGYHSGFRVTAGFFIGLIFVQVTKAILDSFEDVKTKSIDGNQFQKMLLIIFVMTLHSVSEGIGIGVSFGGVSGISLGKFITFSLAMHNIPEGLAVALVLSSRKVSNVRTGLWCVFTSIPQPFMAALAYMFIERFVPLVPAGLGFAAGAMIYVAIFELLIEAAEDAGKFYTAVTTMISFILMFSAQVLLKHHC